MRIDIEKAEIVYNKNMPEVLKQYENEDGYVDVSRAVIEGLLLATMYSETKKAFRGLNVLRCSEPAIENTEGQDSSQSNIASSEGDADSQNKDDSNRSKRRRRTDMNDHRVTKVIEQMSDHWAQKKEKQKQLERNKELREVRILNLNWDYVAWVIERTNESFMI